MAKGGRILALAIILATLVPHEIKHDTHKYVEAKQEEHKVPTAVLPELDIKVVPVIVTGYDNDYACTQSGKGITASGARASRGTIASPSGIMFGTKVHIGDEVRTVQDRGGAINVVNGVYHFDLWFPTHKDALKYGKKYGKAIITKNNIYIRVEE